MPSTLVYLVRLHSPYNEIIWLHSSGIWLLGLEMLLSCGSNPTWSEVRLSLTSVLFNGTLSQ